MSCAKTRSCTVFLLALVATHQPFASLSQAVAGVDFNNPVRTAQEDQINKLPGLEYEPKFKQYSGYLEADDQKPTNRFWHYWFVESQSNPATDPLVLWLNGGPGCSSLLGLLTELGPFRVNQNGTIEENVYAWNKRANIIFMESPAGVGFSYATNGDVKADDNTTARQNYLALKSFLRKFPQFRNSPLYLTGESYGGVYLPTLAVLVDEDKDLNLKGVAIGNGYLDANKLAESLVYFSYYHGLVGSHTWQGLSQYCCNGKPPARGHCQFTDNSKRSDKCSYFVSEATDQILNSGVNPYNLYDQCYGQSNQQQRLLGAQLNIKGREHFDKSLLLSAFNLTITTTASQHPNNYIERRRGLSPLRQLAYANNINSGSRLAPLTTTTTTTPTSRASQSLGGDPPCTDDSVVINYLNQATVRSALHIPDGLKTAFTTCFDGIQYTMIYPASSDGLAPQMRKLINSPRKLTLLVYNGDVDLMCNFFGDEWFVDDLNRKVLRDYEPWHTNRQVSGFVKHYDGITYVTVKGSGHMVPTDRPAEALHMFETFLDGMRPISN